MAAASTSSSDQVQYTSKEVLALLPPNPVIRTFVGDDGSETKYFLCNYSNIPCDKAVGFPEPILKGQIPKPGSAPRLRGRFVDYNCMVAWWALLKNRVSPELYAVVTEYIVRAAGATGRTDFFIAPPAAWLKINAPADDPNAMTAEQWFEKYAGRRYLGCDVRAISARRDFRSFVHSPDLG